jgi:hypothetical protein
MTRIRPLGADRNSDELAQLRDHLPVRLRDQRPIGYVTRGAPCR